MFHKYKKVCNCYDLGSFRNYGSNSGSNEMTRITISELYKCIKCGKLKEKILDKRDYNSNVVNYKFVKELKEMGYVSKLDAFIIADKIKRENDNG